MNLNGFAEIVRDEIVENSQNVTSLSEMECEIPAKSKLEKRDNLVIK